MEPEVERGRAGAQDQSLSELYLKHRSGLISYAIRITGSHAEAEDIVQDAYLRIASSKSEGVSEAGTNTRRIGRPLAYLYQIVRNLAMDRIRRSSTESVDRLSGASGDLVVAPLSSPEYEFFYRDQLRVAVAALAELPQRTQIAFEMYWLEGHTLHRIAERLNVSVTLAHQLVRRAAAHCKERLDEPNFE